MGVTSLQDPDNNERDHVELGRDWRQESQAGRGQEAKAVDLLDPEHFGEPAADDLGCEVAVAEIFVESVFSTSPFTLS